MTERVVTVLPSILQTDSPTILSSSLRISFLLHDIFSMPGLSCFMRSSLFWSMHCCMACAPLNCALDTVISHKPDLRLGASIDAADAGAAAEATVLARS